MNLDIERDLEISTLRNALPKELHERFNALLPRSDLEHEATPKIKGRVSREKQLEVYLVLMMALVMNEDLEVTSPDGHRLIQHLMFSADAWLRDKQVPDLDTSSDLWKRSIAQHKRLTAKVLRTSAKATELHGQLDGILAHLKQRLFGESE